MRKKTMIAILLAGVFPGAAFGVSTAVNDFTAPLRGTTVAAEPDLAGTVIQDRQVSYSTPPGSSRPSRGTIQVRVTRAAGGTLIFEWRIMADPSSRDEVRELEITGFPRMAYNANWARDGVGSVAPTHVSGANTPQGWVMRFVFSPSAPVRAGQSSRFFFLKSAVGASRPAQIRVRFSSGWSANLAALGPAC